MNNIIGILIFLVMLIWSIVTTVLSILLIPVYLLIALIGLHKTKDETPSEDIYNVHVPIQEVPLEYHKAYTAYLKSPEWRSLRKLVLKRDKYRCVDCRVRAYHQDICPDGTMLQVHHLHYDGISTMTFSPDQCVSVCKDCHNIRHGR